MAIVKCIPNRMIHSLTEAERNAEPVHTFDELGDIQATVHRDQTPLLKFNFKYQFPHTEDDTWVSVYAPKSAFKNSTNPKTGQNDLIGYQDLIIYGDGLVEIEYNRDGNNVREIRQISDISRMYNEARDKYNAAKKIAKPEQVLSKREAFDMSFIVNDFVDIDRSVTD